MKVRGTEFIDGQGRVVTSFEVKTTAGFLRDVGFVSPGPASDPRQPEFLVTDDLLGAFASCPSEADEAYFDWIHGFTLVSKRPDFEDSSEVRWDSEPWRV